MEAIQVQQLIRQALDSQEQRFQVTITNLQKEINALKINNFDPSSSRAKSKLPNVDKFDGTFAMWEVWYSEICAKLRVDSNTFENSDEAKFWYVYGRLEKKVQSLVSPQLLQAEQDKSYDPEQLFIQLARLCENPNAKRDAQDKLYSLKQFHDQTFNQFLAVFERQLYKADAGKWSDDAKIALIRRQLNESMTKRLRTQINAPAEYGTYVKMLQQLDDNSPVKASGRWKQEDKHGGEPMQIGALGRISVPEDSEDSDDNDDCGRLQYNPATGKYRKI